MNTRMWKDGEVTPCDRCGRPRRIKNYRPNASGLCADCRSVEPNWPNVEVTW